jgi:hypothetical protein
MIGKNIGNKMKVNYGLGVMMDVYFSDEAIYSPRLKFFYNYLTVFGLGINLNDYFLPGFKDTRLCPEVNFTLFGRATLSVGYGILLRDSSIDDIGRFKLGLSLNLID